MKASVEPSLKDLRAIYDDPDPMGRYHRYVDLMTKARGELLPLGDFSPMGKRQARFLDQLIALDGEAVAARACGEVEKEIGSDGVYRVMLVVVDEPRNGWTQRFLTDAEWRFARPSGPWVTVPLWTTDAQLADVEPTAALVRQTTRAALFRAEWQRQHGLPKTLDAMLAQEGATLRFAGEEITVSALEDIRARLEPLRQSTAFPVTFAAMYGDAAAESVGYEPLGIQPRGGFALALSAAGKVKVPSLPGSKG